MNRLPIYIILIFSLGIACSKTNTTVDTGTIKDFTGLDGCALMIVLDSGKRLEPVSLPTSVTIQANRRVKVKYQVVAQGASICMAGGIIAKIISLQYL